MAHPWFLDIRVSVSVCACVHVQGIPHVSSGGGKRWICSVSLLRRMSVSSILVLQVCGA